MTARRLEELDDELGHVRQVCVVAAGKASLGMASAAMDALGDRLVAGVATIALAPGALDPRWLVFPAGHPLPSVESERAGRAALDLAAHVATPADLLLVCLSGGASAMLAVPAPGLTLDDKAAVTRLLLKAGVDIGAMNVVRRHLSAIKGGQLAARASRTITLAISDVSGPVEDDPVAIGSGPTVRDPTSFTDALEILDRHHLTGQMPAAVVAHLRAGAAGRVSGPVGPGDPRLDRAAYWIVASRHDAMRAAAATARRIGYAVHIRKAAVAGAARDAAGLVLQEARSLQRPACLIASGETTVHVTGTGRGGRNQELAVAALEWLGQQPSTALASIGTDGIDGPTDAAGAIVDSSVWPALGAGAREICAAALADNDAYPLLDRLGVLVKTGPTGTNVGDLQVLLLG